MSDAYPILFHRGDSRLMSYWKFQESSGMRKDWGPGRNELYPVNNPGATSGRRNDFDHKLTNALQIVSGLNQALSTQGGPSNMSGINFNSTMRMTLGGWFNFNGEFPNTTEMLVGKDDGASSTNRSWVAQVIRQSSTSGVMGWISCLTGGAASRQVMYGTNNLYNVANSGKWLHLTWVMDAIGGSGGIYFNSNKEPTLRSTTSTGDSGIFEMAGGITSSVFSGVASVTTDLQFGRSTNVGPGNLTPAHCAMSEVFICSGILTPAEIKSIYHNGIPISGSTFILDKPLPMSGDKQLAGWWRLEKPVVANSWVDSSTSGNHLTASGSASPVHASGMYGNAFQHRAVGSPGQGLYLRNPSNSGVSTTGSFSVGAWYNKTINTGYGHIVGVDGNGTPSTQTYTIDANTVDGLVYYAISNGSIIQVINHTPARFVNSGVFYHVAMTYDASTSTWKAYLDGQNIVTSGSTAAPAIAAGVPFSIGNRGQVAPQNSLDGVVDEAFVYRRVLTDVEIASIYDFGLDVTSFPPTPTSGHIGGYIKVFDYIPDSGQIGGYLTGTVASVLESGQIAGYTFSIYGIESGQIKGFSQAATSSGTSTFTTWIPILQRSSGTFDWGFSLIGQANEDFGAIFRVLKTVSTDFGAKLQVINSPRCPSANIWFLSPSGANAPMTIYASGSGIAYGGKTINRLEWQIPEGGRSGTEGVKFTLNSSGLQIITLKAYDSDGLIGMDARIINTASGAMNKLPQIQVSGSPHDGETPLTVNFSGTYTAAAGDSISHKLWKFGNDQTSILNNPSTLYQSAGCWIPVVRVNSALGYVVSDLISSGVNSL